jgi:hypothetical protein
VGVGEDASERADWAERAESARECNVRRLMGDMGASDAGGVGTTARANWSRRIAISLFASRTSSFSR